MKNPRILRCTTPMIVKFVTSGLKKNMFRPEKSFRTINRLWTHHSFFSLPVVWFSITQLLWRFMFSYQWGFRFWSSGLWYLSVRQVVNDVLVFWLVIPFGQTGDDWCFGLLDCDTIRSDRLWLTFLSFGLWYRSVRQVVTDVLVFWLVIPFGQTGCDWRFGLLVCDTVRSGSLRLTFWSSGLWYRSVRQVVTDVAEKNTSGQQTSSSENLVTYYTTGCTVFSVSETYLRPRYAQLFLSLNHLVGTAYFSVRGLVNTKNHF